MNDLSRPVTGQGPPGPGPLREVTDYAVLGEVFHRGRVTRVELAAATGISRPTIWEAVRRLERAGLLIDVGSQETGRRGRAATFYELARTAGWVLAADVGQAAICTRAADLAGRCLDQDQHLPVPPGDAGALEGALCQAVRRQLRACADHGPLQAVALSVASPVHPGLQELIGPPPPFPDALRQPARMLADLVRAPLVVENSVNLAALAERQDGAARRAASFAYLYVGARIGLGLYLGGQLVRGARGLAGEIGQLGVSAGDGEFCTLAAALPRLGLGRPGSPAGDVAAVLDTVERAGTGDSVAVAAASLLGETIGQVILAACAIADPELVLLGGPIGGPPAVLELARAAVARAGAGAAQIEAGSLGESAFLQGALHLSLRHGRRQLLATPLPA